MLTVPYRVSCPATASLSGRTHWIFYWDRGDLARPRVDSTTAARSPYELGAHAVARERSSGVEADRAGYVAFLRDMASRRARCLSNSAASASRIRTSDLSRAC